MATIKVRNNEGNWISVAVANQGGGGVSVEPMVLTGEQNNGCTGPFAAKYIELFGDTISTEDINNAQFMFFNNTVERIPFDINMDRHAFVDLTGMFNGCSNLKELPIIFRAVPSGFYGFLWSCYNLREIPEHYVDTWDFSFANGNAHGMANAFSQCYSLRSISSKFLKNLWNIAAEASERPYNGMFADCYSLNEAIDIGVGNSPNMPAIEQNMFDRTFNNCHMLKRITFETNDDGTPIVAQWSNQTIELCWGLGWVDNRDGLLNYNSGIAAYKEVYNDDTYQALKDDPDWFTMLWEYSRYNHDSAVETINSLPDTSAFVASTGGTNTIIFKGVAGLYTDGGAINTLTEDEIAVANAKGWNVVIAD